MKQLKDKEGKTKAFIICPICKTPMLLGKVEKKLVACCENKKCLSTLVLGEPLNKKLL